MATFLLTIGVLVARATGAELIKGTLTKTVSAFYSYDKTCLTGPCARLKDGTAYDKVDDCLAFASTDCVFTGSYNVSGVEAEARFWCQQDRDGKAWWALNLEHFKLPIRLQSQHGERGYVKIYTNPSNQACEFTLSDVITFGAENTCGIPESGPTTTHVIRLQTGDTSMSIDYNNWKKLLGGYAGGLVGSSSSFNCGNGIRALSFESINYDFKAQGRNVTRGRRLDGTASNAFPLLNCIGVVVVLLQAVL
eukprot:Blabericola_migrator_1__7773@NODE_3979_length_1398_cov_71_226146_g683_i1_p1_GENE_NODE_3979_length_1398_cov_71_226146_g683_i1NODE_3979_length_1398_cov_71_226146_g683_i1_p1_ORF_typecomplete_len250_score17_62Amidase_6/PF12671_7/0_079_NODE_3979_length_1398_cov_71_226146_g683_i15041253